VKYRSRTDIAVRVLQTTALGGATKTKIMYDAYLSHSQLKAYLALMLENRLITYLEGTRIYRITPKGVHFLRRYAKLGDMVKI
jgi:predicted transcriptional regulator